MKALYFNQFGNADVLKYGDVPDPECGPDTVLVKNELIGLNYADIYRRRGTYHIEQHTPWIDGYEGVGRIVRVGSNATQYKIGARVLFVDVPFANAELVAVPADHVILLPDTVSDELAVTLGLQGLTAYFLAHDLGQNKAQSKIFIHGISSGVGQLLTQILVSDGMRVSGSASNAEKRELALIHGAEHVYTREESRNADLMGTFDTVYDGVGSTLQLSFDMIKHRGKVVFFGMAGGQPSVVDPVTMMSASKSLMTGDLWDYLTDQMSRQSRFEKLFAYHVVGNLHVRKPTVFALADGKQAHELMESGQSARKIVLKP